MAAPAQDSQQSKSMPREQPWLVTWNRKLRHLQRISIRNLTTAQSRAEARRRIADDDALPGSLKSPAKQIALREGNALGHSRSSDDLRPLHDFASRSSRDIANGTTMATSKKKASRPAGGKLRRRSTLDWASDSPQGRQKRMEALSAARLADVFFSLHVEDINEPIYVSEVATRTMNADFRRIDLDGCGPDVTRMEALIVKLWVRSGDQKRFSLLLDLTLNLRSLQFIGKDLARLHHPFPPNAVVFQLSDGFYTSFAEVRDEQAPDFSSSARTRAPSPRTVRTSSFDALLRLSKLDESIQDAVSLQKRLSSDLEAIIGLSRAAYQDQARVKESEDFAKTFTYAKSTVDKQIRSLKHSRERKALALQKRKDLIASGRLEHTMGDAEIRSDQQAILESRENISTTGKAIRNQRRRISADLGSVYPIAPLPNKPLSFSIRGLFLPDSEELESSSPDVVAAALGHVAQVLQLATFYLNQALPYPQHPRSSTSSITDPISNLKTTPASSAPITNPYITSQSSRSTSAVPQALLDASRNFPLHPRSSGPKYRFEYGLFLLNKNIETLLSNAFGIRVLDIRQTLPNLAYILACMGAGEGELPSRKAGGIRGLARGPKSGTTRDRGDGKGIVLKREWQITEEDEGIGKRGSFKPGRSSPAANRGKTTTALSSADWEGVLRGDTMSTKKAAGLVGKARRASSESHSASMRSDADTLVDGGRE